MNSAEPASSAVLKHAKPPQDRLDKADKNDRDSLQLNLGSVSAWPFISPEVLDTVAAGTEHDQIIKSVATEPATKSKMMDV